MACALATLSILALLAGVAGLACKRGTLGDVVDGGGAGGGAGRIVVGTGSGGSVVSGGDAAVLADAASGDAAIDAPLVTDGPVWVNSGNLAFCPHTLPAQICPVAPPVPGSACVASGARCDYGDNPNIDCRESWTCGANLTWQLRIVGCTADAAAACPAQVRNGDACATPVSCSFADGRFCTCGAGTLQWACWTSPLVDCPPQLPAYGSPCGATWMLCHYGGCFDYEAACCNGMWIPDRFACSGGP